MNHSATGLSIRVGTSSMVQPSSQATHRHHRLVIMNSRSRGRQQGFTAPVSSLHAKPGIHESLSFAAHAADRLPANVRRLRSLQWRLRSVASTADCLLEGEAECGRPVPSADHRAQPAPREDYPEQSDLLVGITPLPDIRPSIGLQRQTPNPSADERIACQPSLDGSSIRSTVSRVRVKWNFAPLPAPIPRAVLS